MANAAEYTDPYLTIYTPVPPAGPGVCAVCHSGPRPGYGICRSCNVVMRQVSRPTPNVVPVSLYRLNSQLWHVLRHYKDGARPSTELLALQVAAVIARFTAQHLACIATLLGGQPDIVTSVPSTRSQPRPGRHPLETAVTRVGALASLRASLLRRGPAQTHRLCALWPHDTGSQRQPSLSSHSIVSPSPATPVVPWSSSRQNSPGS
jgi:hypothetical protein